MKSLTSLLISFCLVLLTACGGEAITPEMPPEILYGEDVCDQCGMIISDERFAAGLVVEVESGIYEHRIFDDIGEMIAYAQEHASEPPIVSYFVHDYHSKEWLDAEIAYFVQSETMLTPMGYGLVAFAHKPEAEAWAQEWQGSVFSFAELHSHLAANSEPHEQTHN